MRKRRRPSARTVPRRLRRRRSPPPGSLSMAAAAPAGLRHQARASAGPAPGRAGRSGVGGVSRLDAREGSAVAACQDGVPRRSLGSTGRTGRRRWSRRERGRSPATWLRAGTRSRPGAAVGTLGDPELTPRGGHRHRRGPRRPGPKGAAGDHCAGDALGQRTVRGFVARPPPGPRPARPCESAAGSPAGGGSAIRAAAAGPAGRTETRTRTAPAAGWRRPR